MKTKCFMKLEDMLSNIVKYTTVLKSDGYNRETKLIAEKFIHCIYDLGQAIEMRRVDENDRRIKETLNETAVEMVMAKPTLQHALDIGYDILDADWEPYGPIEVESLENAYYYLSAQQFFLDLYRSTCFSEYYSSYEMPPEEDATFELVEERVEKIGPLPEDRIPPGIPATHWWWWAPEKPPIGGTSLK